MDHAVALVESYLHVNGYFTVQEYPLGEACKYSGYRCDFYFQVLP